MEVRYIVRRRDALGTACQAFAARRCGCKVMRWAGTATRRHGAQASPKRRCANPSSATSSPWLRASRDTGIGTSPPTGILPRRERIELGGYPTRNHVGQQGRVPSAHQHAPGGFREMGGGAGGVVRRNGRATCHGSALHRPRRDPLAHPPGHLQARRHGQGHTVDRLDNRHHGAQAGGGRS